MTANLWNYDFPVQKQLGFQDPSSAVMEEIINFHNYTMIYLTFIVIGVLWVLVELLRQFTKSKAFISHKYMIHGTMIELIWTITPAIILVGIAFPSFKLLHLSVLLIPTALYFILQSIKRKVWKVKLNRNYHEFCKMLKNENK